MELRITHETRYDYSPAVETAQHMAHLPKPVRHQRNSRNVWSSTWIW